MARNTCAYGSNWETNGGRRGILITTTLQRPLLFQCKPCAQIFPAVDIFINLPRVSFLLSDWSIERVTIFEKPMTAVAAFLATSWKWGTFNGNVAQCVKKYWSCVSYGNIQYNKINITFFTEWHGRSAPLENHCQPRLRLGRQGFLGWQSTMSSRKECNYHIILSSLNTSSPC